MDANIEQALPSPEVLAFRRYYNDLLRFVDRPVDLAESLFQGGFISRKVRYSITSRRADVEQGRVILDAMENALLESSQPRTTLRLLVEAWDGLGFYSRYTRRTERFADCECTKSLINA